MPLLLVVDSDPIARAQLTTSLAAAGHEVESTGTAEAAIAITRASRPEVILVDPALPDGDGLAMCRAIAAEPGRRPSFCVLSATSDEASRVAAFEAGVDDFVTKPYSTRELVLRLRSLARRRSNAPAALESIALDALKIDRPARRVEVAGESIELTRREFDLLLHLVERAGRVQTRDVLVAGVWGETTDSGRVVDTTVKRLRKKLGARCPPIRTVRGVGYKIVAED